MTDKQLAANRANAQKSTGPKTPEGKRRSSLNASRHQLTGKIHVSTLEDSAAFDKHCSAYHEALAPIGIIESDLAQEIAEDRWRLKRARSLESSVFALGHQNHADAADSGDPQLDAALAEGQTWIEQAKSLQLLTLYENRIRRAIEKNTVQLEVLQAKRKTAFLKARTDAFKLSQLAEAEGETYDPAADFEPANDHGGFIFSAPEIERTIDRRNRLHRAWEIGAGSPGFELEPEEEAEEDEYSEEDGPLAA
jgi:hypothetical protein